MDQETETTTVNEMMGGKQRPDYLDRVKEDVTLIQRKLGCSRNTAVLWNILDSLDTRLWDIANLMDVDEGAVWGPGIK